MKHLAVILAVLVGSVAFAGNSQIGSSNTSSAEELFAKGMEAERQRAADADNAAKAKLRRDIDKMSREALLQATGAKATDASKSSTNDGSIYKVFVKNNKSVCQVLMHREDERSQLSSPDKMRETVKQVQAYGKACGAKRVRAFGQQVEEVIRNTNRFTTSAQDVINAVDGAWGDLFESCELEEWSVYLYCYQGKEKNNFNLKAYRGKNGVGVTKPL